MKPNSDIRQLIRQSGFCSWQVAEKLGVHENTFYRMLRKTLSEEDKKRIYKALEELRIEKEKQSKIF
ncbi:hypothetical protein [Parageobacillus thermoglucosidasius]|uniref:hypothetical protein n=1 Tax=Parageobacillus thermoglucosidasius TaxID=1426 RepID=UPI000E19E8B8|nr:hypothetical protein [Parageobacillus thermoglucosidasius]MED4903969.1 hypothetical protein [Parageobacillus thermoglucosidasius]MED4915707.1 hypothetical protein [Parageobacillus thermoglucosidasius]MED4945540.1 hypothetical protein [Parageobacillus thermoglucosidasius]MED4984107.1 hypothetical protein [Parageobacillus thermoglucosidasius]RDE18567.1 hypothetical protein DV714_20650 [Parageobacillus thermoglucosidasius]